MQMGQLANSCKSPSRQSMRAEAGVWITVKDYWEVNGGVGVEFLQLKSRVQTIKPQMECDILRWGLFSMHP